MIDRRLVLGMIAVATTIDASRIAFAKEKHHLNGKDLLGEKIKKNGKQGFADDIAWQCAQLGLQKPIVIGHSFGGAVVLELCGRYPELASGMVMIDSIVVRSSSPTRGSPMF